MACCRLNGALRRGGIAVWTDGSTSRYRPGVVRYHTVRIDRALGRRLRYLGRRRRRYIRNSRLRRCRFGCGLSQSGSGRQRKNRSRSQCDSAHLVFSITEGERRSLTVLCRKTIAITIGSATAGNRGFTGQPKFRLPNRGGICGGYLQHAGLPCMALINRPIVTQPTNPSHAKWQVRIRL
jgi:hypothetical protein